MPDWLRQTLLALAAFLGGQIVTTVKENVKRANDFYRSVDKLTDAVSHLGEDLRAIRDELHEDRRALDRRFREVDGSLSFLHRRIDSIVHKTNLTDPPFNESADITLTRRDSPSSGEYRFSQDHHHD